MMPSKRAALLVIMVIAVLSPISNSDTSKIRVAVSYGMISAPIKDIGGDLIEVTELLPPSVEPHDYSLSPSLVSEASNSDILVISGHLKWELDLSQQVAASKGIAEKDVTIDYLHGLYNEIKWLTLPNETGVNLHGFWYLPENYLVIASTVKDRLTALRPEYSEYFEQNHEKLVKRIDALMLRINEISGDFQQYNRKVLITSPEEQYLIAPFSLEVGESLVGSSEEITLSASKMSAIITSLQTGRYSLVITSDLSQLMKIFESAREISAETGAPIVELTAIPNPSIDSLLMYNAGALMTGYLATGSVKANRLDALHYLLFAIIALLLGVAILEYYLLGARRR